MVQAGKQASLSVWQTLQQFAATHVGRLSADNSWRLHCRLPSLWRRISFVFVRETDLCRFSLRY